MKHTALFTFSLLLLTSSAAIPQRWDVELTAQPPQVITLQRPRGETYELEAVLKIRGKPFAPAITNACIYWQTNGMENLYWSAPASVSNNVLRASWLPSMDPGATTVRGYIGDPGHIYAAAFQFRFIASPGALPNALPLPVPVIDFAKVRVLNPPWPTNAVTAADLSDATNRLHSTLTDYVGAYVSETNAAFSNSVLAVCLNIDTNDVAAIHALVKTSGDFPVGTGATTVGALLAALAGAVAWLKRKKVGVLAIPDGKTLDDVTVGEIAEQMTKES